MSNAYFFSVNYAKEFSIFDKRDFWLAALFLCKMPLLTALSTFLHANLKVSKACSLLPAATLASKALIAVFKDYLKDAFNKFFFLLVISRFCCCLMFAIITPPKI